MENYLNYLHSIESKHTGFDHNKLDVLCDSRVFLVDWIVQSGSNLGLMSETVYLSVNIMDKVFSKITVEKTHFKLVALLSLVIAHKYYEEKQFSIDVFMSLAGNLYDKKQVLRTELRILRLLDYDLTVPTSTNFLDPILDMSDCSEEEYNMACLVLDYSLFDHVFLKFKPSVLAYAAVCCAKYLNNNYHFNIDRYQNAESHDCITSLFKSFYSSS